MTEVGFYKSFDLDASKVDGTTTDDLTVDLLFDFFYTFL